MKVFLAHSSLYRNNARVWLTDLQSGGMYVDMSPSQASGHVLTRKS